MIFKGKNFIKTHTRIHNRLDQYKGYLQVSISHLKNLTPINQRAFQIHKVKLMVQ